MKRFCVTAVCLVFALALFGEPVRAEDTRNWPSHLRLLTGPDGGQWSSMGMRINEVLSDVILPTTSRAGGGTANLDALNKKNGEIAFTLACFLGVAQSGEEEASSLSTENVHVLSNVYPQVLYFLVRKEFADLHGITSVRSLLEKKAVRFASLRPGTASEFILSLVFKYGYGTSFEKLRDHGWNIQYTSYPEAADNLVGGDLDCFAYTAGTVVPLIQTLEQYTDLYILPLDQDALDVLEEKFKTHTYVIAPRVYKSVTSPVRTLGDYTTLVIRKDLPDSLAHAVIKTLWERRDDIGKGNSDFVQISPKTAVPKGLTMHPGARRFWESIGGK